MSLTGATPCATVKHSLTVQIRNPSRRTLTMRDWEDKLDAFLLFNEREVLTHAGKLRAGVAEKLALERFDRFDAARREAARLAADAEDMAALEQAERQLEGKGRGKKK
jgi:hypothetical protein